MVEADIVNLYHKLSKYYPLILTDTLAVGYTKDSAFPILRGTSSLGNFEMFFDDLPSFEFYAMHNNGELLAHTHFYSISAAEQAVADFMEGKLTLISFGQ